MSASAPSQTKRPVMLVILDGFGWREDSSDNAVRQAHTPVFDALWKNGPRSFLRTSGEDVGLPNGQMGNSEVGHLNIGAGRVVMQELPRITTAIQDGSVARSSAMTSFINTLKKTGGTCHLLGLVSPGGVHAHQDHAAALARMVAEAGVPVAFHVFTDGRDTPPRSAQGYLETLRAALPASVKIATVSGRYYAMDRDKRWDRLEKAYNVIVSAEGPRAATAQDVVAQAYQADISDEFIEPTVLDGYTGMKDGDGLLSFNFRADRIRQLLDAMLEPDFDGFARHKIVKFSTVLGMTHYSDTLAERLTVLFPPDSLENILGEVVSRAGRTQLRMAETEKYPHVTYFLNGGREKLFEGEDRIMVPSPKVATYDLQPEMSAPELTDKAVAAIESGQYDLIVLNFANPDMVGHTGVLKAAIKAVETVDAGTGRIIEALKKQNGSLLVTADHGNCETMKDPETGVPHTAHTLNVVPLVAFGVGNKTLKDGRLADLAPTLLDMMGLPKPDDMTGTSLLTD
ncbi:2,3-bisphosphoglycerate-independent phosphoglycerate mutase [Acetobacter cerevisiae]|uniref:2,3-bisphosphoglycerate-independent phosphoglycerate mutase n=1 Tax=Acetobacter cerevisiae TaxID=178900 RepID=A0A149UUE2_9PROT|nr:2,3-bisphosphoglycerate-independent phosphoglycerate mutase [Acetobacter cerevisiae]KXV71577.1 phosphoglyceromutase [Acetobacter cerevisiae]MCP1244400.1 2,3-bisphosphoglycerate-independent phosphoglycerate mutase [Acetobacter cerevisiae]MCP1253977.1 2,3-bisphosphoglycerate-independent phosphoglycerate mutase [Acetobacter cerevisiae]